MSLNILNLFTGGSHHRKNSVIFLTQKISMKKGNMQQQLA
jgi:hypothetical protein